VSGWSTRSCGIAAAAAAAVLMAGCGGGSRQDVNEPLGNFPVQVSTATFPATQSLSEHTHLVIKVVNAGTRTIPDIAVTICNLTCVYNPQREDGTGTAVQAFGQDLGMPYLANPSRPVWIVDRPPGSCGYSCRSGGPGSAVTAYTNTWALGQLKPGQTAIFDWGVTAVKSGMHVVAWAIAAGLNGKARAVLSNGGVPAGSFRVRIRSAPRQAYVNNSGQIVASK
jgi:hypothetical protein